MEVFGEVLTIHVVGSNFREFHGRLNVSLAEKVEQMWKESHIPPIAQLFAHIAVGKSVTDAACRQSVRGSYDWLKERGFERQDRRTVRTGAFGIQNYQSPGVQQSSHRFTN